MGEVVAGVARVTPTVGNFVFLGNGRSLQLYAKSAVSLQTIQDGSLARHVQTGIVNIESYARARYFDDVWYNKLSYGYQSNQ